MKGMHGMKYKLPKPMKEDDDYNGAGIASPDMYQRRITVPVSDEMLEYAEVGEECIMTLAGKITGINSNESDDGYESKTVTLEVTMVEKYGAYEAEKDFSNGMDNKMKRY